MDVAQQQHADRLRRLGWGDRRIAAELGLTRKIVRGDRERRYQHQPPPPGSGARILLYDIETAPALVWVWNQWKTDVIATEQDWYLLSVAWRWLGTGETGFVGINQDPAFTPDSCDDRMVAQKLADLFDQADCTVAHNGDRFDLRKANARFLYWGIDPPSPSRSVDTKKETQRYFANYSNSLSELGRLLRIGEKRGHSGFSLWRACMRGDEQAWKDMEEYNRRDLDLLEALYLRLQPWIGSPGRQGGLNLALFSDEEGTCPHCGGHSLLGNGEHGKHRTRFSEFETVQCADCGGHGRMRRRVRGPDSPV